MKESQKEFLKRFNSLIEKLAGYLEKRRLDDFVKLMDNPRKLMYINFMAGLARGLGMAIGFTLLGAIFLYFLFVIAELNLPLIGEFIARIVRIVQNQL